MPEHAGQAQRRQLPAGKIEVAPRAIATIAAQAAGQAPGVVGVAACPPHAGVAGVLHRGDAHKGVEVRFYDDSIAIDLYIIAAYGAHLADVARAVQASVRQVVVHALGMPAVQVHVHIQGVQ